MRGGSLKMTTELWFHNQKIPVSFISSDQKAIPQLISVLERKKTHSSVVGESYLDHISRIEIVGNNAILHSSEHKESLQLPLY